MSQKMLVKVLTGVFDPAPEPLAVPWVYLVVLIAAGVGSTALAVVILATSLNAEPFKRFARSDAIQPTVQRPAVPLHACDFRPHLRSNTVSGTRR